MSSDQKRKGNSRIKHQKAFDDFVVFTALSYDERDEEYGYHFKQDFAKAHHITPETLSRWANLDDFWKAVQGRINEWARDKTPIVVKKHFSKIISDPGAAEVKLWYQKFEGFSEKQETTLHANRETLKAIQESTKALVNQENKEVIPMDGEEQTQPTESEQPQEATASEGEESSEESAQ